MVCVREGVKGEDWVLGHAVNEMFVELGSLGVNPSSLLVSMNTSSSVYEPRLRVRMFAHSNAQGISGGDK